MSRIAMIAVSVAGLTVCLAGETVAQNKPAKKDGNVVVAHDEQYKMLSQYKEMVGVVQSATAGTPNMITLRVQYDHPTKAAGTANNTQNNQIQQHIQRIQQAMASANNIKNPIQRQQRQAQLQNEFAQVQQQAAVQAQKSIVMVKDFIDYELPLTEKAVIRTTKVGADYDDKGNLKEAPPAEKGQVGVAAKFEDLNKGDEVKVYFATSTPAAKTTPKKDDNGALVSVPANRPRVRMVVITKDVDAPPPTKKNK